MSYLFASHPRISVGGSSENKIIEYRGVRSDSNSSSDHNSHFKFIPILVSTSEWALQAYLKDTTFLIKNTILDQVIYYFWIIILVRREICWVEEVSQLPGPRALRLDVAREEILVGRRGERERVELFAFEGSAGQAHPLTRQVFEVGRAVELDFDHVGRKQLGFENIQLHEFSSQGHHLN